MERATLLTRSCKLHRAAGVLVVAFAFLLALASGAAAAPGCTLEADECPQFLGEFGSYGSGAGQLDNPRGIAADPDTGHIYVAESAQPRISEFTAGGDFVKAWGFGVLNGAAEPQICTTATGCQAGVSGSAAGQFSSGLRPVVDEEGFIWVLERANLRLQKFTPGGTFLLMAGGEVNKTKVEEREEQEANAEPVTVTEAEENLCTAASGDLCGVGTSGTGNGQFQELGLNNSVTLAPGGTIYIGDRNRIQKFGEDGTYAGDIDLPGAGTTRALTVAPSGRLYVISDSVTESVIGEGGFPVLSRVVREIGPAGEELDRLVGEWQGRKTPKDPVALATDADGNVYVIGKVVYDVSVEPGEDPKREEVEEVIAFEPEGDLISFETDRAGFGRPVDTSDLFSIATNVVKGTSDPGEVLIGQYDPGGVGSVGGPKAYVRAYGTPFEKVEEEPEVVDQYVLSVTDAEASLGALINPRFTAGTTYQVQYGTGKCSEGSCESAAPVPPAPLGGGAASSPQQAPATLSGLQPGTIYHYRFFAENDKGDDLGEEGTFRTYADPKPLEGCSNQSLRLSFSAWLPDCRAYEMVSPIDKGGVGVIPLSDTPGYPAALEQASLSGDGLTYSSFRAFAKPESSPYASQYLAERDMAEGWSNEAISPPREGVLFPNLTNQYRAFSDDLSESWLITDSEPPLDEGAIPSYRNLYHRNNASGAYQVQCPTPPPGADSSEFRFDVQGRSADGSHLVFRANDKLTPDAASGNTAQLYECIDGTTLRLVSVLEGGEATSTGASAGSSGGGFSQLEVAFRNSNVTGAVSDDGSRIFWTASENNVGPLYVRIGGDKTVQISASNARFRMASPHGGRVIYTVGDELFEAAVGAESATSTSIADEVDGFMGASRDTELLYFVSGEDLDGGGPAAAGENNLYLYRSGPNTFIFIAQLSDDDAREAFNSQESTPVLTPVALNPYERSSRVTADGLHAAFTSTAPLTGYDNTDQVNGKELAEVFLYDAAADELHCASCNPTGALPQGANLGAPAIPFWVAAKIPGWADQFHASRVLSEDGERLFFEAIDPLALGDDNGVLDVYQWQAPGSGSCTEGSSSFSSANGGCIDLISTGNSNRPSEIVGASPTGDDVFFKTAESLWSPDPGLTDIYDARVGGGFAPPAAPPDPCVVGNGCQSPSTPPPPPNPQSPIFTGPEDQVEKPKSRKPRCRKGTRAVKKAGKWRCVKNKKKSRKVKNNKSRRAGG